MTRFQFSLIMRTLLSLLYLTRFLHIGENHNKAIRLYDDVAIDFKRWEARLEE